MIDRARGADQQLAERYLAGQLTADETREFEEAMLERPEVLEQVELARQVKLGLKTLRERGELETLVRAKPRSRQVWFAAAAAALLGVAGFLWLGSQQSPAILVASLGELGSRGSTGSIGAEYLVARTRGQETLTVEANFAQPVIAIRLLMPSAGEGQSHHVELLRNGARVAALDAAQAGDYLPLYLDTSHLEPGEYELRVSGPGETTPVTHRLRLIHKAP